MEHSPAAACEKHKAHSMLQPVYDIVCYFSKNGSKMAKFLRFPQPSLMNPHISPYKYYTALPHSKPYDPHLDERV